ncbi:integrin alpha-11 isoform X2 [Mastacembelus armatus]|uniref:integrin alpha-11 isoform X2 n=1 Tax=Mastacembelus armatus TaxID=205130 RepID=UPI000E455389|nr:integrin alpha-11-like isoform X2 [Mastacembelus armatus]
MDYSHLLLLLWSCSLLPDLQLCFNFDTKNFKIFFGSKEAQFGYTVQQHEAGGRQWLLVGAPFESTGRQQTGDVYRCPLDTRNSANCSRLNLGKLSLDNVSERKDNMRLGMTLTSNPKDSSFVTCGPLWSHECGSSLYSTGLCSRIGRNFRLSHTIAPALQRCEMFMDIVIVLDGSNSIYPWYEVQDFLINVLHKFYIGPGQTQVGVVQYGSTVVHEFSLGEYHTVEEVVEAARSISQRGGEETRTALGINVARLEAFQRGGRPGAQKVMIVITDGESHDSPQLVQAVADSERDNITMYAIAVLGYYNRRGINPEAFLKEIKFIATDPDEKHFFNVTDESALKDIVDALGERIFSLEGTTSQGRGFGLQMAQAGFSSHLVKDGVLLGAVGAYDWNGAVLKDTKHGKVVPPKSSYKDEFPEDLKNHGAYLGYAVGSLVSSRGSQLYVAGAPRFNHTGKVIIFTLRNTGNLTILHALLGEQIGSYFGSELLSMDVDSDGHTDVLLVAAPMYYSQGWERGRVYIYTVTPQMPFFLQGALEVSDRPQNSRLGSALAQIPDMNGDGFTELVVGAPLEDDHQGAVYVFYGQDKTIRRQYRQRLSAATFSSGLQYFGQSLHGVLDMNADGLVDLAVGALGAAVIIWSRGVVRIHAKLTFEPEKVNIFNKDCQRGGKDVTCMSVIVCLSLDSRTNVRAKTRTDVALWYSLVLDERRFPPRAVLDELDRQQPRTVILQSGGQSCQRLSFSVQETTDYGRPIAVVLETGMQDPDEGPVLDPDWPSTLRAELPFWNGCEQEDTCVPDLILHSHTDLMDVQQFCSSRDQSTWSLCRQQGGSESSGFVVEAGRRRMVVFARLENQGENAYGAAIHISTSSNLLFSSLIDQSDIQIECYAEDQLANQRFCNISAPFMKSLSQVSFRLEFEFSRSVFLDHVQVVMVTSSEGEEGYPDDNINDLLLPLRYQMDLLFTRDPNPPRFEIKAESTTSPWDQPDSSSTTFNLTYSIQNLGFFSVQQLLFRADLWAVTRQRNQLLNITDCSIQQVSGSHCVLPQIRTANQVTAEDLCHLSQLNHNNSMSLALQCRLDLPASTQVTVTLRGRLQLPALLAVSISDTIHPFSIPTYSLTRVTGISKSQVANPGPSCCEATVLTTQPPCCSVCLFVSTRTSALRVQPFGYQECGSVKCHQTPDTVHSLFQVNFRSLEILVAASIQLEASSPMFLQEDRPVRQIILELRKEEDYSIPVWVILGSLLGGLLLLALLVLALWKLGFFNTRRRQEEEEQPVANGKAAEEL